MYYGKGFQLPLRFDLDSMADEECKAEFRFYKNDIYLLGEFLDIPDIMKCPNGVLWTERRL